MEDFFKFVSALGGLFLIYKIIIDVILARSSKRRDEYTFSKEFISDLENETEHNYTLEKGFHALSGENYSVPEIKLLLAQQSPTILIDRRAGSGDFLLFDTSNGIYKWRGVYKCLYLRSIAYYGFNILYFILSFTGIAQLLGLNLVKISGVVSLVGSVLLIGIAVYFVIKGAKLDNAKRFMEDIVYQNKTENDQPNELED